MLEKVIERKVAQRATAAGWYTRKFSSPAHRGVPDRLFLKDGRVVFIELKTPTGRVSKLQEREIEIINAHGGEAHVCRSVEECMSILGIQEDEA